MTSQSGSRSRIATWYKDAAVNSTGPPFPTSITLRTPRETEQEIDNLRRVLVVARKETHHALQKFTQTWEAERKAQVALAAAEDRRGELSEFPFLPFFAERCSAPPTVNNFMEYTSTHHNMLSCECFFFFFTARWGTEIEIFKTPLHP